MDLKQYLERALDAVGNWEGDWGPYDRHPALTPDADRLSTAFAEYTDRLRGNYPFFHPRYAGQMLKPPHPVAVAGYMAAMLINPNNHALDGGPPTAAMEKEVVAALADMFGFPEAHLGHLTSSGTIANLEALWVSRELHPERGVAYSAEAHYTHGRMSQVLGLEATPVPADEAGRIRLDALEAVLEKGTVGTVVLTAGTTGLGAVDPIAEATELCRHHGVRIHVDAAYGGFFTLLAGEDVEASPLRPNVRRHFRAIAEADSVVVDPHKHGLQPYGCGCVLFRDPTVGRFYRHDSPYTYFTSDDLHLGEISLECSRAGAAAGALWLTLQVLPLASDAGLGPILAAGLRAAQDWYVRLYEGEAFLPYVQPELDIVTFLPLMEPATAGRIDEASSALFDRAMNDPDDPLFLSLFRVSAARLAGRIDGFEADRTEARILRSVLMKPEHETHVRDLHERLTNLIAGVDA